MNGKYKAFIQFVKFGIVGLGNTFVNYAVYAIVILLGLHYQVGNVLGFLISVLNSFYWNNRYVFRQQEGESRVKWKALLRTYLSYAFSGLVITPVLLYLLVETGGLSEYLAPFLIMIITIPLNFFMNKHWAFRPERRN
ncbi:GtrA family protein [Parasporobacterium paucivorans]|uniref:Putative flippase GtrA (Transmembrane translocase of bactoprenol-linked glucose) n=1 Tax=Parasporobacterium paucivorans DSM 15970 TaxID=1122934 RepID=A0A1M6JTD2_9FIRM|nr:GtrA family protein [Parasporobacterium paucivorans]SHJ49984.1 Putative flippase GtrA (transmembrane translocase of bactoprenol-linked glucose) [Parasporobacterium paucivorans DSM 15970]